MPGQCDLLHLYDVALGQRVHPVHDLQILLFGAVVFAHSDPVGPAAQGVGGPLRAGEVPGGQGLYGMSDTPICLQMGISSRSSSR